ncbi:MAG: hypothetical protein ACREQJ_01780 [Candidatus Binatia bacterium]
MTGSTLAEREEVVRIAKSVLAGQDGIDLPADMVHDAERPEPAEDDPRALSIYAQIKSLNVPQRVKLAMKGNRESRAILLRDTNRLIPRMVLMNPRITEDEIIMIAKDRNSDVEILRQVGDNRDWVAHYGIRAALVENARTPVALALRLLKSLQEREVRILSKSKNVSSAVASQARRMMFRKQGGRTPGSH